MRQETKESLFVIPISKKIYLGFFCLPHTDYWTLHSRTQIVDNMICMHNCIIIFICKCIPVSYPKDLRSDSICAVHVVPFASMNFIVNNAFRSCSIRYSVADIESLHVTSKQPHLEGKTADSRSRVSWTPLLCWAASQRSARSLFSKRYLEKSKDNHFCQ